MDDAPPVYTKVGTRASVLGKGRLILTFRPQLRRKTAKPTGSGLHDTCFGVRAAKKTLVVHGGGERRCAANHPSAAGRIRLGRVSAARECASGEQAAGFFRFGMVSLRNRTARFNLVPKL